MGCSVCRRSGHNSRSCPSKVKSNGAVAVAPAKDKANGAAPAAFKPELKAPVNGAAPVVNGAATTQSPNEYDATMTEFLADPGKWIERATGKRVTVQNETGLIKLIVEAAPQEVDADADDDDEESETEGVKVPIGQGLDAVIVLPVWLNEEEKRNAMAAVGLAAYKNAEKGLLGPDENQLRDAMRVMGYEFKVTVVLGNITFRAAGDGQTWIGTGKNRQEALTNLMKKMFPSRLEMECFKRSVWRLT